ncbi:MAG: hypothetical protein RI894_1840, partial [Bacteroidota bacterium]
RNDNAEVSFERSHYETYGSNVQDILRELFTNTPTISAKAYDDLKRWQKSIADIKTQSDLNKVKKEVRTFGDSFDKLLILTEITNKAKELNLSLD